MSVIFANMLAISHSVDCLNHKLGMDIGYAEPRKVQIAQISKTRDLFEAINYRNATDNNFNDIVDKIIKQINASCESLLERERERECAYMIEASGEGKPCFDISSYASNASNIREARISCLAIIRKMYI
jgi:hypothetical protein